MRKTLSLFLSASFLSATLAFAPGCIFVHVKGDLDEGLFNDDDDSSDFHELSGALEDCLVDPHYDLNMTVSPWHQQADWTVRYTEAGSDEHMAFVRAKEAVMKRIQRERGVVTAQHEEGPHAWSCSFRIDDDDDEGKASVKLVEHAHEGEERPYQLEVSWKKSD